MTMFNAKFDLIQTLEAEIAEQELVIEQLDYHCCSEEAAYITPNKNIETLQRMIAYINTVM